MIDDDTKHILHCFFMGAIFSIIAVSICGVAFYINKAIQFHFKMKTLDYVSKNEFVKKTIDDYIIKDK